MATDEGRCLRVAVVENDIDLRRLFGDVLTDAGFVVTLVADPSELSESWAADIVISDSGEVAYRRADVRDLVARLRERTHAKIVLMSTHREIGRDVELLGADAIVAKPFELDDLLRAIRTATENDGR